MIASHRRRHRNMIVVLSLPLAVVLFLALKDRSPIPASEQRPSLLGSAARPSAALLLERQDLFGELPLSVRLLGGGGFVLAEIELREPLHRPDVLAYWSPVPTSGTLPDEARPLGPLHAGRTEFFRLPAAARETAGHLLIYSLAHGEVLAEASLPPTALSAKAPPATQAPPLVAASETERQEASP